MIDAKAHFGSESFAAAVPKLLLGRRYADAMWAARLAQRLESESDGEQLTDEILKNSDVHRGIVEIGDKAALWQALFSPAPRIETAPFEEQPLAAPAPLPGDGIQDRSRRRDDFIQRP
jgi:hypothetical protein